jgi:hypothetical protein
MLMQSNQNQKTKSKSKSRETIDDETEYVKIYQTEKNGISLQITKTRTEILKKQAPSETIQLEHGVSFLWKDIGRNNYFEFITIISIMSLLAMPSFMWTSILYNIDHMNDIKNFRSNNQINITIYIILFLDIFILWTISMWIAIFTLLLYHIWCMSRGLTSREQANPTKFAFVKQNGVSLFSKDTILGNIKARLFPRKYDQCFSEKDIDFLKNKSKKRG